MPVFSNPFLQPTDKFIVIVLPTNIRFHESWGSFKFFPSRKPCLVEGGILAFYSLDKYLVPRNLAGFIVRFYGRVMVAANLDSRSRASNPSEYFSRQFGFVERSIPRFIDDSGGSFEVLTAQSRCTCSANKTWRVLWRARERKVSSVSSIVREVIDIIDQIYPTILFSRTATNPNSPHLPSFSPTFSQPPSSNLPLLPTQRRRKKESESHLRVGTAPVPG